MPRSTILHGGASLNLIGLLVDDKAVRGYDCSDLVLLLLSTDKEDLILDLDRGEILWDDLSVADADRRGGLRSQIMDLESRRLSIEVVESWSILLEDVVWLKADNVMEEAAEFVDFRTYLDLWSRVFLQVTFVCRNCIFKLFCLRCQSIKLVSLLQDLEELSLLTQLSLLLDAFFDLHDKGLHAVKCLLCEVLARWCVLLNAFQVLDGVLSDDSLLIDDRLQLIVLTVHLPNDFFLDALLSLDNIGHVRAAIECVVV